MMAGHGGEWGGDEEGYTMIQVLCSQRDRFKDRVNQLELQLAHVHLNTAYAAANAAPFAYHVFLFLCALLQVLF